MTGVVCEGFFDVFFIGLLRHHAGRPLGPVCDGRLAGGPNESAVEHRAGMCVGEMTGTGMEQSYQCLLTQSGIAK